MVSQISGLHLAVGADGGRRVAGNHAAVDHHGDAVGNAEHGVHVVLHQQNRVLGFQLGQHGQHALGFFGAHAGQRLVQQQHLRLGGQAHGDFELALLPVREQAGRQVAQIGQAAARHHVLGNAAAHFALLRVLPPQPGFLVGRLRRQAAVLEHAEGRVDGVALVAAA